MTSSGKAETAVQVIRNLQDTFNKPLSTQTTCRGLKQAGLKAAVKANKPLLSKHHMKERLDFAIAHKDWTVED